MFHFRSVSTLASACSHRRLKCSAYRVRLVESGFRCRVMLLGLLTASTVQAQSDPEGLTSGSGGQGDYVSAVRNVDGDILVAYASSSGTQNALTLALCDSVDPCINAPDIALDPRAPANSAGHYTQLLDAPDGNPVLVHIKQGGGGGIRVVKCGDSRCGIDSMTPPGNTAVSVPTPGGTPVQLSAALDAEGRPIISAFLQSSAGDQGLWVIDCTDAACLGPTNQTQVEPFRPFSGQGSAIVLGHDGFPVIAFRDRGNQGSNGSLAVMKCNDPGCIGSDEQITLFRNFGLASNRSTDLVLNEEGLPRIAYMGANQTLFLLACSDPACADSGASENIIATDAPIGPMISMVLDSQQRPLIAVHSPSTRSVQVIACNDARCEGQDEVTTVMLAPDDATTILGNYLDLAADENGEAVLVYQRTVDLDPVTRRDSLRLETCLTLRCQNVFADGFESTPAPR